jgi:hypothetical protein
MTDSYDQPPSWFHTRVPQPVLRALVLRAGFGRRGEQNVMRVLRVPGLRSGRRYEVPVRIAVWNDQRYFVSVQGESQWARNPRAARTAELLVGASVEPITARELRADEKAAFLAWYCREPAAMIENSQPSAPGDTRALHGVDLSVPSGSSTPSWGLRARPAQPTRVFFALTAHQTDTAVEEEAA